MMKSPAHIVGPVTWMRCRSWGLTTSPEDPHSPVVTGTAGGSRFKLGRDLGYLAVQTSEDGYDYTFYGNDLSQKDGGQLDNPDFSMEEAVEEILRGSEFVLSGRCQRWRLWIMTGCRRWIMSGFWKQNPRWMSHQVSFNPQI